MERKRLVIHIGSHKTATTFIQSTFFRNRDLLERAGILYPRAGEIYQGHFKLVWSLKESAGSNVRLEDDPEWKALLDEIEGSGCDTVLVSSEDFEWFQGVDRLAPLRDRFDVRILYYMRSPEGYLESYYNQVVKDFQTRETRTLERYMAEHSLFFLNNDRILRRWSRVFGVENLSVRVFRKGAFPNGIHRDVLYAIGKTVEGEFREAHTSILQKVSLPPDALEFLRLGNRFFAESAGHHAFVASLVAICQEHRDALQRTRAGLLSLAAKQNVLRRFQEANRAVARLYLGREDSPFNPEDATPHPDYENRLAEANAEIVAHVAALIRDHEARKRAEKT